MLLVAGVRAATAAAKEAAAEEATAVPLVRLAQPELLLLGAVEEGREEREELLKRVGAAFEVLEQRRAQELDVVRAALRWRPGEVVVGGPEGGRGQREARACVDSSRCCSSMRSSISASLSIQSRRACVAPCRRASRLVARCRSRSTSVESTACCRAPATTACAASPGPSGPPSSAPGGGGRLRTGGATAATACAAAPSAAPAAAAAAAAAARSAAAASACACSSSSCCCCVCICSCARRSSASRLSSSARQRCFTCTQG